MSFASIFGPFRTPARRPATRLLAAALLLTTTSPQWAGAATGIGLAVSRPTSIAVQADGKIVVAGESTYVGDDYGIVVARYNTDGTPDFTFSDDGLFRTVLGSSFQRATGIAVQGDGGIVVSCYVSEPGSDDFVVLRLTTDGDLDPTFDGDGIVTTDLGGTTDKTDGLAIQADGKIVVVGTQNTTVVAARYNSDGSLDPGFDTDGLVVTPISAYNAKASVAIQDDGSILVGAPDRILRYDASGSIDLTFDGDGILMLPFNMFVHSTPLLAIQDDGAIVAVSDTTRKLLRFHPDGTPDSSFDGDGVVDYTNFDANGLAIQTDGKVVLSGVPSTSGGGSEIDVHRYLTDGSPDAGFGTAGEVVIEPDVAALYTAFVALESDDDIVVTSNQQRRYADGGWLLMRLVGDGTLDPTFEDDGIILENDCRRVPLTSSSCIDALDSTVLMKRISDTSPQRFRWRWRGDEGGLTHAGLGNPATDTQYTVCVYDTTASEPALASWITFGPEVWFEKPERSWRWRQGYGNSGSIDLTIEASAGGLPRVRLKFGVIPPDTGLIPLPVPLSPAAYFDQDPSVTVQLVSSEGLCWRAAYTEAETKKNADGNFAAKTQ